MSDTLLDSLDRRAVALGVSRSHLIRQLIEKGLAAEMDAEKDDRFVAGYSKAPQEDGSDDWGDLDKWTEAAAKRSLIGLSKEEQESW